MTTPFDYDRDPDRFRLATRVTEQHLTGVPSLYELLAGELAGEDPPRILDIGCGEGALRAALPFVAGGFGAAVAVNVLDHLADPTAAIREAHRVLAAGGWSAGTHRWCGCPTAPPSATT
jgi:hypothetical protein